MISITPIDNVWSRVLSDNEEEFRALYIYFRIEDPALKYTPRVRSGLLDGKRDLIKTNGMFYWGMKDKIINWCQRREIQVIDMAPVTKDIITDEEWNKFVASCLLPFDPYDYQSIGARILLENRRHIGIAATSAGKSLMLYLIIRWLVKENKKTMLVVPDVGLVEQMFSDLKEYWEAKELEFKANLNEAYTKEDIDKWTKWLEILKKTRQAHNFKSFEDTVCMIYAGHDKFTDHIVKISTFQSIYELGPDGYFNDVEALVFDECVHPDTRITTKKGKVKIKDITIDDIVLTYNEETKIYEWNRLVKIHKNIPAEKSYDIILESGDKITITGNHKVLIKDIGWKRVDELQEGDDIISYDFK